MTTSKTGVIGATSSLGISLCRILAEEGTALLLTGRNAEAVQALAQDVAIRHNTICDAYVLDLLTHHTTWQETIAALASCDTVYFLAGDMGGPQHDAETIARVITVNYLAAAQILQAVADHFAERGHGQLVIISSVAGERGRQSNYLYGSAKAGLTAFASGLRNALSSRGVHVMTVLPGFIDTPLTWGMESPLLSARETVARRIITAARKRRDVVYVPWFWRYIMLVIRHIPERIFKRMRL